MVLRIVVHCDFNINCFSENDMRKQLDALLTLYNLTSRIDSLTKIQNKSSTAINDTFINTLHFNNFLITPLVNGLSDHDAKLLTIDEINLVKQTCHTKTIWNINKNSIIEFQIKLRYELWDNVLNVIMAMTIFYLFEKDQQDAHFYLTIYFNLIILDMFRTNNYSSSGVCKTSVWYFTMHLYDKSSCQHNTIEAMVSIV